MSNIKEIQMDICSKYNTIYFDSPEELMIGISKNVRDGVRPIHGLRHSPENNTTGWFIWAGEYSEDKDFFIPLHVKHLKEWCPFIIKYLGLPPGWRFLATEDYEDVWEDSSLLEF